MTGPPAILSPVSRRQALSIEDVPVPTPAPGEVLLRVEACGVCRTDLHVIDGDLPDPSLPLIPGHEIVGRVTAVGSNVTKHRVGDRVGVGCYVASCGACSACEAGDENYCPDWSTTYNGYERDGVTPTYGGYSDHIVVDEHYVLRIPEGPETQAVAPLLGALLVAAAGGFTALFIAAAIAATLGGLAVLPVRSVR